jgi:hypothetical protein
LASFDDSPETDVLPKLLVTYSKKAYEDLVIRLLRSPSLLPQLRDILTQHSTGTRANSSGLSGLFDTEQLVQDFLSAMFGLKEIQHIRSSKSERRLPHLLVVR